MTLPQSNNPLWEIRLFGGPILIDRDGTEYRHFRSQKVGALLAFLTLHAGAACPREQLYDALWPDEYPTTVANRFRVTLASLRRQLEPHGTSFGTVLDVSEPGRVRLRSEFVRSDFATFHHLIKSGKITAAEQIATEPLLPHFYDEWAVAARSRCEVQLQIAQEQLARQNGQQDAAFYADFVATPSARSGNDLAPAYATGDIKETKETSEPADLSNSRHSSLPIYLTRFFGRTEEVALLLMLLQNNRLVTVTGIGGIGKTRLVVEALRLAANNPTSRFSATPIFVALDLLEESRQLPNYLARALGQSDSLQSFTESELSTTFAKRGRYSYAFLDQWHPQNETYVILDTGEHPIENVEECIKSLLGCHAYVKIVVTSRQPIGYPGEVLMALSPLDLQPVHSGSATVSLSERDVIDPGQLVMRTALGAVDEWTLELLRHLPLVALFVDRARQSRPDFTLTGRNSSAIYEICSRLAGIPLALELAAARMTTYTPAQLALRLRTSLSDLTTQRRTLLERHRSLQNVIETTLAALPADVRTFFLTLTATEESWTLELAQQLTGNPNVTEYIDLLLSISLITAHEDTRLGVMRFNVLKVIRQIIQGGSVDDDNYAENSANLILNGSFESDRPNTYWPSVEGGRFAYPFIVPDGWHGAGSVNINVPSLAGFPSGIPHGTNTAVAGDHTRTGFLYQDVPLTVTAGETYSLTAWVGSRAGYPGSGRVVLSTLKDSPLADSGIVAPMEGTFLQVLLEFTATPAHPALGSYLRVRLEHMGGAQANFDDVRLMVRQIPMLERENLTESPG